MTGEAFEYAIKKDVRNNPIVRAVDGERHREMWRSITVGMFLVAVLLFFVWRQVQLLQHGYDLGEVQKTRQAQEEANAQLRLDLEALRALARIEMLAERHLRMIAPGPDDQGVIERVVSSPVSPESALAHR